MFCAADKAWGVCAVEGFPRQGRYCLLQRHFVVPLEATNCGTENTTVCACPSLAACKQQTKFFLLGLHYCLFEIIGWVGPRVTPLDTNNVSYAFYLFIALLIPGVCSTFLYPCLFVTVFLASADFLERRAFARGEPWQTKNA